MTAQSMTRVGRIRAGYRIRVEGRGTLRESPAAHAFARHVLDSEPGTLIVDLDACVYLDSTFLGGLIDLHRRYAVADPPRVRLVASPATQQRLLVPNCLETLFHYCDAAPEIVGPEQVLATPLLPREELGQHVLECHRRLVEIDGPNREALQGVVDRLERELSAH